MNLSVSPSRPCVGLGSDLITDVFAEDYTREKAFGEVSRSFFFSIVRVVGCAVFDLLVNVFVFKECAVLPMGQSFSYYLSHCCVICMFG